MQFFPKYDRKKVFNPSPSKVRTACDPRFWRPSILPLWASLGLTLAEPMGRRHGSVLRCEQLLDSGERECFENCSPDAWNVLIFLSHLIFESQVQCSIDSNILWWQFCIAFRALKRTSDKSYVATRLQPFSLYQFRVVASNQFGSTTSDVKSVRTKDAGESSS